MIRFKPTFEFEDRRGILREVIRRDNYRQLNEVRRHKGQNHGLHYHKINEELFYIISGKVKVEIINVETKEKTEFIAKETEGFIVEPYEVHNFIYLEDTIFIVLHSRPFDKDHSDIHEYKPED